MSDALVIEPRTHDIGGLVVRRVLPFVRRRSVGPFVFFDHMGPAEFAPGEAIDVRPHPHIGLATLTFLYEGQILHSDSLGSRQTIDPGDVNWMIAGRGIVHSERVTDAVRLEGQRLNGLQLWIALPAEAEEMEPEFHHHAAEELPKFGGATLVAGSAFGRTAPVKTLSPLVLLDMRLEGGESFDLPPDAEELALYPLEGEVALEDAVIGAHRMAVLPPETSRRITAKGPAHLVALGGAALPEPRFIDWNFVSSRRERIDQAKEDWRQRRFPLVPGDEKDFIPLPE